MNIYLASPANQLQAECLDGQCVLESFGLFAKAPWLVRYRPTFKLSMLDSGAYSVMSTGTSIDIEEYIEFAVDHQKAYEHVVNLDVISGDVNLRVDQGMRNLQRMRDAGVDAMPVFHQGEPWSVLEDISSCGRVGLGLQRPIQCAEEFLDGCFSRLLSSVYVHGFAMANEKFVGIYPFGSVDTATWVHELKALMSLKGQGSDVLQYLTQSELIALIVKKYKRIQKATAWAGKKQFSLFAGTD